MLHLENAGRWFLCSGIQTPGGGVARYYRSDLGANVPVSMEITGYSVSALTYLHSLTGKQAYLDAALRAARFLARDAWDSASHVFPFEPGSDRAYFFDTGIIVRGLLAVGRATGEEEFCLRVRDGALSLAFDFLGDDAFHPIISLPEKQPLPYEPWWSRSPGCYQLKSALAWLSVNVEHSTRMFDAALARALATHESFLACRPDCHATMDRLHPYCYFLEALLFVANRPECASALVSGIARVAELLRQLAPVFERSDACAQLLRVRLIAHHLGVVPLDEEAACEEARRLEEYQACSSDPRIDGGFYFGKKDGEVMPFVNPVSTAFGLQALALWQDHLANAWRSELAQLI